MSSRRSRSGGRWSCTTFRRWKRSSRNVRRCDAGRQVDVGGGDQAEVGAHEARAAEAAELALLQDAQQLGLRVERQVADLVEEERAAVGQLEHAGALRVGAGERAALVTEELALERARARPRCSRARPARARDRALSRCRMRATSSLPVPVSPVISTETSAGAMRWICSHSRRMAGLRPRSMRPASTSTWTTSARLAGMAGSDAARSADADGMDPPHTRRVPSAQIFRECRICQESGSQRARVFMRMTPTVRGRDPSHKIERARRSSSRG